MAKKKTTRGAIAKASPISGALDFVTGYPKNNALLVEELGKLRSRILSDETLHKGIDKVSDLLKRLPS